MNENLSTKKTVSHKTLFLNQPVSNGTDYYAFSSINPKYKPKPASGIFVARLDSLLDERTQIQMNYFGRLKPYSQKAIEELAVKRKKSAYYIELDRKVKELIEEIGKNHPQNVTENLDVIVLYKRDMNGEYPIDDVSVVTFGKEFLMDENNARFMIQFAGDFEVSRLSELRDLPGSYLDHIGYGLNEIKNSLQYRHDSGFRPWPNRGGK